MENKRKFKVGDRLHQVRDFELRPMYSDNYIVIEQITSADYIYSVYGKSNNVPTSRCSNFDHESIEKVCEPYPKKIANTKISREIYKGRIEKEEGDALWVL